MKIVIVGDGKVGSALTERLAQENHDITVIDNNPEVLTDTTNYNDVIGLVGNGATAEILEEAGVEKADVVVAATSSDERNILCALIAKKLGAQRTIARVRTPEYYKQMEFLKESLGLSMYINPEYATAGALSRMIRYPSAMVSTLARGRAEMVTLTLQENNKLVGLDLFTLKKKFGGDVLVCAIQRKNGIIVPDGSTVLEAGDKISVIGGPINVDAMLTKANLLNNKIKDVMIVGGGRIAYYLAMHLMKMNVNVKIIEIDNVRCRELCELLPGAEIIHGDASNHHLLIEEGMENMDVFVSLTGLDEHNIMLSLFARAQSVPSVITKVNNMDFHPLLDTIGLDAVISPKIITADMIVSYVRGLQNSEGAAMETMFNVLDGQLELLDFRVTADLPYLEVPLKKMKLIDQTLIAIIVRNGFSMIPNGDTVIKKGDNVIVLTEGGAINRLGDIIKKIED